MILDTISIIVFDKNNNIIDFYSFSNDTYGEAEASEKLLDIIKKYENDINDVQYLNQEFCTFFWKSPKDDIYVKIVYKHT